VPAAHSERVEVLWTPQGVKVWGTFDPESGEAAINRKRASGKPMLCRTRVMRLPCSAAERWAGWPGWSFYSNGGSVDGGSTGDDFRHSNRRVAFSLRMKAVTRSPARNSVSPCGMSVVSSR
jgi:hypothetical protein